MWYLAVDFGTSYSAGAMLVGRGVVPLEIAGAPRCPSAVMLTDDGTLIVGSEAAQQVTAHPERVERTPKRRLGRTPQLLLGGEPIALATAIGAVIEQFLDEGRRRQNGEPPAEVLLTHPARWSFERLDALRQAARTVGIADPTFVPEPVGAAAYYADEHVTSGEYVAVYDLGGGTFDTAVLRRSDNTFELVGPPGGDERIGGEDFDFRLYRHLGQLLADDDQDLWKRLTTSDERRWKRANAELISGARQAKETLSRYPTAQVLVREADRELVVTRSEFEALITDDITQTVAELAATIERAGLSDDQITRVYLAGGSSRIPLVQQRLVEHYGDKVSTWDDPKCVVALGAAKLLDKSLVLTPGDATTQTEGQSALGSIFQATATDYVSDRQQPKKRRVLPALASAAIVAAAVALGVLMITRDDDTPDAAGADDTTSTTAQATATTETTVTTIETTTTTPTTPTTIATTTTTSAPNPDSISSYVSMTGSPALAQDPDCIGAAGVCIGQPYEAVVAQLSFPDYADETLHSWEEPWGRLTVKVDAGTINAVHLQTNFGSRAATIEGLTLGATPFPEAQARLGGQTDSLFLEGTYEVLSQTTTGAEGSVQVEYGIRRSSEITDTSVPLNFISLGYDIFFPLP